MCVCVCVSIYIYIYAYMHIHRYVHVCIYIYMYIYMCVYIRHTFFYILLCMMFTIYQRMFYICTACFSAQGWWTSTAIFSMIIWAETYDRIKRETRPTHSLLLQPLAPPPSLPPPPPPARVYNEVCLVWYPRLGTFVACLRGALRTHSV